MLLPPNVWNSTGENNPHLLTMFVRVFPSNIEWLPVNFAPNQCRRRRLGSTLPWWLRAVKRRLANLPSHKLKQIKENQNTDGDNLSERS